MKRKVSDRIYRVNEEIAHREIEGIVFLLTPYDYSIKSLNETGRFIWLQILKKRPLSKIVKNFAKEFGISDKKAQKDVLQFIKYLGNKNITEMVLNLKRERID